VPAQPLAVQPSVPASDRSAGTAGAKVVAIGASAGGLEACTKFLGALQVPTGMAFILVQHLDPTHSSLLVELLADRTGLTVLQAADRMPVEPEHLFVIPPGFYLSVDGGALHLTASAAGQGARLPFDVLLCTMAAEYGARAACVVLSGMGNDGSVGLRAVKQAGGLVLVQDPDEADHDGMPRSAIATGVVDAVAPAAGIPRALVDALTGYRQPALPTAAAPASPEAAPSDPVAAIIDLLRVRSRHDFAPYKHGTLERRIERRMMIASVDKDAGRYLDLLHNDPGELDLLAKDLLIHVTGFFRDPPVFHTLAEKVIPGLLRDCAPGQPLRIWVVGCSTGEEVYSLFILFREAADVAGQDVRLQVFASDIDADAVATAREGLYPPGITSDVSADRLARFFSKEDDHGYRVLPDLRAAVVFTVQNLLNDPPFSRIDLLCCRNLMIYLGQEAQAKAAALFHFALKEGGVLLLGSAETVGAADDRFELMQKAARLYRHVGRRRPGDLSFAAASADGLRGSRAGRSSGAGQVSSRQAVLAELCRRAVLDVHAPAAVLCNSRYECLYSLGPTDRYLRVPPGFATAGLLAMARGAMQTRLRSALVQAVQDSARVTVAGGRLVRDSRAVPFSIDVQPLQNDDEVLLLVCFVDAPALPRQGRAVSEPGNAARIVELERELDAARAELKDSARILEASGEEQRIINEEALSVNEEYQSTNEELLTSKEELQSLNEELIALNNQLQETLERQRTTSNDLQNILYSTNVATLFLDRDLNIRFFTPTTKALFSVIPGDIGRPLADLRSLATDTQLPDDARTVLQSLEPVDREVETPGGTWFRRRVLPYRTEDNGIGGVVITFNNVTRRKQAAAALEDAKQEAEAATLAKSRFLAAASHDLRQPLQTLALLQGLLTRTVADEKAAGLLRRQDEALDAMSGMLDTLLDLNQIEAGVVRAEVSDVSVNDLLSRLRDEFTLHAQAKGLTFRILPCSATIRTDPRLLEQMLRNLLSNALKYTGQGRVLVGCRRQGSSRGGSLRIEVWDTGVGIPEHELHTVFQEYHQLDNAARERGRGLGLGLSIVQRLGTLLGHRVHVRSQPGRGSVFSIEVVCIGDAPPPAAQPGGGGTSTGAARPDRRAGSILVVEDDPELCALLTLLLQDEGHQVTVAPDGSAALQMIADGAVRPDLVLADHNLPGGMSGLQVAAQLREALPGLPVIVLTGDIQAGTVRDVAQRGFMHLSKPVKPDELVRMIQELLPAPPPAPILVARGAPAPSQAPMIFVVDDDSTVRAALRSVLEDDGCRVEEHASGAAFLAACGRAHPGKDACLLVDAAMPGMDGLELLRQLGRAGYRLPAIMITGNGDVSMAVRAMKAGALDFIEKPVRRVDLLEGVRRALSQSRGAAEQSAWHAAAAHSIANLTQRQREVMALVLAGHPSKNIAADLGLSQRTVENHRASIMRKTGARSLPALARLALAAAPIGEQAPAPLSMAESEVP